MFSLFRQWCRDLMLWKYAAKYHPISLIKTCDLDPEKNYLMGYHPHGVFVSGACALITNACDWDKKFPGIDRRHVCLDVGFHIPGFRELFLCTGCISSSRKAIKHCLRQVGRKLFNLTKKLAQSYSRTRQGRLIF